ncbi:30S ribosome-binding factor RbfA [Oribacterium sp. WCC10]|uniref:30S ribosome-binding factor RbfA n=1 Tax=Oribacterium sp. WCC10 TaxID=1855343 RepID=UPI0008ECDA36|nr:30S ribosome-binding factor RbfA [Oribacterium sp. WCC10]SFG52019.1 ribosome-binding factor A [Oribacterium sp. WCC10]
MRKNSVKNTRINAEVMRELSVAIRNLKDPRISPMVSVTGAEVTPDLQYCKVYISVLGSEESLGKTMEGLKAAGGFLRRELAQTVNLRHTPELQFVEDHSIEYGARMDALINKVAKEDAEKHVETEDEISSDSDENEEN